MQLPSFLLAAFFFIVQSSNGELIIHQPATSLQRTEHKARPSFLIRIKEKAAQFLLRQQLVRQQKKQKDQKSEKLGSITGPASLLLLIASIFVFFITWPQSKLLFIGTVALSLIAAIITLVALPKRAKDEEVSAKARRARRLAAITLVLMVSLGILALLISSISFEIG